MQLRILGFLVLMLTVAGCGDDSSDGAGDGAAGTASGNDGTGDGDSALTGDGDGDGAQTGDGDGDGTSGDGDQPGDGDGDGDGDQNPPGDGDGDQSGDGDATGGDGDGDGDDPPPVTGNTESLVTEPLNVIWYGASTTNFGSGGWPSYQIPFLVSEFYAQVAGNPLPGTLQVQGRGSTGLTLFWCRNSCSQNCANDMHHIHGTSPEYEAGCNGGMHGGTQTFGEGQGDGAWDYVVASAIMTLNPQEFPPHSSESIYRTLKEIHDYRDAQGTSTRFIHYLVTRDDAHLSQSTQNFGQARDLFMRTECIKSQAAEYGQSMDTLPSGLALYNAYRAMDTAHQASRLDQRSFRAGEQLTLDGVTVPNGMPLYNFDSSTNPNDNVHFSRQGAVLVALTAAYYLYGVDPLLTSAPTAYRVGNSTCNGGTDICDVTAQQLTFMQHIAKYSVDSYLDGTGWLDCEASAMIPADTFIADNPAIDSYDDDWGLDNVYSDPTGDGFCPGGEDCSGVLFPLPATFPR